MWFDCIILMRVALCRVDTNEHAMAGVIDGSLQSLDGKASPVTFMAESPTEKVFSQPLTTGTRRGSFLFRSESDDRTPPNTVFTMTGSASAARLTSMIPEMFVTAIVSYVILYGVAQKTGIIFVRLNFTKY